MNYLKSLWHDDLARAIVCLIACLALFALANTAFADNVYTCTKAGAQKYADCTDANTKIVNTIQPNDLVATTTGTGDFCAVGPQSFWYCATMRWMPAKDLADTTQVGFCGGTETTLEKCAKGNGGLSAVGLKKDIAGITWPYPGYKYACLPKSFDEVRIAKEGSAGIVLWYCDLPKEIKPQWFCGDPAQLPTGVFSLAIAAVISLINATRECSDDEFTLVKKTHETVGVKITVAATTASTRPIYTATATNTKGVDTKKDIAVGSSCGPKRLQDSLGKATNYFAVDGGYALCSVQGVVSK